MRRIFQTRKFRQVYDPAAIVEMARTLSRTQIVEKTGISASHLSQILAAAGIKNTLGRKVGISAKDA